MQYKIKDHIGEIITYIIQNLLWLPMTNTVPLIFSFIYGCFKKEILMNTAVWFSLILSIIISILTFSFIIYKNLSNKKISPITDFHIKNIITELNFTDRENIISSVDYEMIVNNENVEFFEKELIWTGKDYYGTDLVSKNGNYELELFDSNDSFHRYRVNFLDGVRIQDLVNFKLETKVRDSNHSMLPISSYMVKHQIDNLIIRVVVPPGCIKNVKKAVYADINRQVPIGEKEIVTREVIAGKDCYSINIPTPTLLYRFFLEWDFTDR